MSLVAATDPVAADVIGRAMIDRRRQHEGVAKVEALHVQQAADLGAGVADRGAIDHEEVILSPVIDNAEPTPPASNGCNSVGTGVGAALAVAATVAKR